jgi:glycine cleavage system H protein
MIPEDCYYTESHVWIKPEEDDVQLLGVTEPLLESLGQLLSLSLLDEDDPIMPSIPFGNVEGYQGTQQLYLPMEADIIEVNEELVANLEKLQSDPYGEGWLLRITLEDPQKELIQLMTVHSYRDYVIEDLGDEYVNE